MQWYWSRMVLYITNSKSEEVMQPGFQDHGSRSQFLMDGISQTYRQAGDFMHTESTSNFQIFEMLQNTANQVMEMLNEESRLHYPSHLQNGPVNLGMDEKVTRNLRRRERRRGNVRSGAGTSSVQHQNYLAGTSNVEHENFKAVPKSPPLSTTDENPIELVYPPVVQPENPPEQVHPPSVQPKIPPEQAHPPFFKLENRLQPIQPLMIQQEYPPVSESEDEHLYDMYD
ncbi:hypothetical protein R6Q57_019731 [Mikania cordata]